MKLGENFLIPENVMFFHHIKFKHIQEKFLTLIEKILLEFKQLMVWRKVFQRNSGLVISDVKTLNWIDLVLYRALARRAV